MPDIRDVVIEENDSLDSVTKATLIEKHVREKSAQKAEEAVKKAEQEAKATEDWKARHDGHEPPKPLEF